jgi:hypothetical protein
MNAAGTIGSARLSSMRRRGLPARPRRARPRSWSIDTGLLALIVAGVLVALAGCTAAAIRLLAAAPTRRWLHYPFRGVPDRFGVAVSIFAHNGRAMAGVLGLLLVAQVAARSASGPGPAQRSLRAVGELLLAGLVAANVLRVGVSLGAFGTRMAVAMLPHGPVELAAFATALALYLRGRGRPLSIRQLVMTAAVSVALLAAAAALETFVPL